MIRVSAVVMSATCPLVARESGALIDNKTVALVWLLPSSRLYRHAAAVIRRRLARRRSARRNGGG